MGGFVNKIGSVFGVGGPGAPSNAPYDPYNKKLLDTDIANQATDQGFATTGMKNLNTEAQGYNPLIQHLYNMTVGKGPSLAELELKKATDRNTAGQLGLAAGNASINPALAARLAGENIAGENQQAASDAGTLRLNEQIQSIGQLINAKNSQGGLTGNLASLGTQGGEGYQQLAQSLLSEKQKQDQAAYEAAQKRRGEFWAKVGSAAGGMASGGASGGGYSDSPMMSSMPAPGASPSMWQQ